MHRKISKESLQVPSLFSILSIQTVDLWLRSTIHTRPGFEKNIILNKSLDSKCQFNNNKSASDGVTRIECLRLLAICGSIACYQLMYNAKLNGKL